MMKTVQGKTKRSKKLPIVRRLFKVLIKTFLSILLLVILFFIGINIYLQSNKAKIFDDLPFLNQGTISFEATNISLFKDFPLATLSIKNITLHDSLFEQHKIPFLKIGTLTAGVSLEKLMDQQVETHSIGLKDGDIRIFTDSTDYCNLKSLFEVNNQRQKEPKENNIKVITNDLEVSLSNILFHFSNDIRSNNIQFLINDLTSELRLNEKDLSADIDMDLNVEELTFKKGKGSFATGSQLEGIFNLSLKDGIIYFPPFDLKINDEHFLFSGNFDTKKENISTLIFENANTNLDKSFPLLSAPIQKPIKPFQVDKPFYSKTTISGFFKPNNPPFVNIDFIFKNNIITTNGHQFKNVSLKGNFKNRLYSIDPALKEPKGQFKLALIDIDAEHDGLDISSKNTLITKSANNNPQLIADLKVLGRPSDIHNWFENDQFFFKHGNFQLMANVSGPLNNYNRLVMESEAELKLGDFSVTYLPANSIFPLEELLLVKKKGDTEFNIVNTTFQNGYGYQIDGGLKNLPALLFKITERASSSATFRATKFSWTDFLNLFGENGYLKNGNPKADQQKKKSMKETIKGFHYNFQPRIAVLVDTLQYFDLLELHDFKSGVYFENDSTVVLEKTSFKYGEGMVDFHIKMDLSDPYQTPFEFEMHAKKINLKTLLPPFDYFNIKLLADIEHQPENVSIDIKHKGLLDDQKGLTPNTSTGEISFKIDEGETLLGKINYEPASFSNVNEHNKIGSVKTKIELEGKPNVFNEFFKTDQFFFDKGHFLVHFEYEGNVTNFEELLNKSDAVLFMQKSEVNYKLANVTFPISDLVLNLREDNADFQVYMWFDSLKQEINLEGNIENLSELLLENTGKQIKTAVNLTAPKIKLKQLVYIFAPENAPKPGKKQSVEALKVTSIGLLNTFDPNLHIYLDTFVYSEKLMIEEVETGVRLIGRDTVMLDKTAFKFNDSWVSVNGICDFGTKDAAPFSANFETTELDIVEVLESLDHLNFSSLKNIDYLSGSTTLNLDLTGIIDDDAKGLVGNANDGTLEFELRNIILKGFEPLDVLAKKLKMKKRFEEIRFAPITNNLVIKGHDIHIPRMELQSNAINMFVEGTLSNANNTNLWVSIPVDNLKSSDRSTIPEKRGYAATRKKVYIEIRSDKNGKNKFKFRSSKRKFYKQRGILKQYKLDKRKYRKMRKEGN